MNRKVLMSGAEYFTDTAQINPYYGDGQIDVKKAMAEHGEIGRAFKSAGIDVVKVVAPKDCQDGVYTANWGLVRGERAVLANLPGPRRAEMDYAERTLLDLGLEVLRLPEELKFSGQGDSLPCGRYLFCGSGYRSDAEAQRLAAEFLGLERVQLRTVPELDSAGRPMTNAASGWADSWFYDLDLALAVIREDLIAYCPEAFTEESQRILAELPLEKIEVSLAEAKDGFACNLVSTGSTVIMSDRAPELRAELERRGLRVITPHVTELAKGGGFIRCVALTIK